MFKSEYNESTLALVESIYKETFSGVVTDGALSSTRRYVIAEQVDPRDPIEAKQIKQDYLKYLCKFGFDKTMRGILARDRTGGEIGLFLAHASQVFHDDHARDAAIPAALGQDPSFGDTFNRAAALLDRDMKAIKRSVAAVRGKPRSASDLPPR
jgi:hypothetical protein